MSPFLPAPIISSRRPRSAVPWALGAIVLCVVAGVVIFRWDLTLALMIGNAKNLGDAPARRAVAVMLMRWGAFGAVPTTDPEYTRSVESIASRIMRAKGYSESSGIHGDGQDWYELELTAELASDLRSSLGQANSMAKQTLEMPPRGAAPRWWPARWPTDAQCYEKDLEYLILPDTGTRAWFVRIRT